MLDLNHLATLASLPAVPQPDTHCWDDDANKDVWSHSPTQMQELDTLHLQRFFLLCEGVQAAINAVAQQVSAHAGGLSKETFLESFDKRLADHLALGVSAHQPLTDHSRDARNCALSEMIRSLEADMERAAVVPPGTVKATKYRRADWYKERIQALHHARIQLNSVAQQAA